MTEEFNMTVTSYEPASGDSIQKTAERMVALARARDAFVVADVFGVKLTVGPTDFAAFIVGELRREVCRRKFAIQPPN
jgi:hypothetical protein